MQRRRLVSVLLMAVALILVTIGAVNADLQSTNVLRAWDDVQARYENGNMVMFLNAEPETFYTKLDFDTDLHADACGVGTSTQWAGDAFIGLYHTDNAPAGAPGFQSTLNWKIVDCRAFDPNDTTKFPTTSIATCIAGQPQDGPCVLIGPADVVTPCSTGNCQDEIVTNFHINTDLACDGTMDEPFASLWSSNPQNNNLCLYWEAVKPPANVTPRWNGNFQVRYGAGAGGDKTINFSDQFLGPNAVSVRALAATAEANSGSLAAWAAAMLLGAAALYLWRRRSSI